MSCYIGLTGGIASGKSMVATLFNELGCYTLDLDSVSKIIMRDGDSTYDDIIKGFGEQILNADRSINRAKLKTIIFQSPEKRKLLESIVHPAIWRYEKEWMSNIKSKDNTAIMIVHAALIIEAGRYHRFDKIIVTYSSFKNQLKRLMHRDSNLDEKKAKQIISTQLSTEEKLKYAHYIINNDNSIAESKVEVQRVFDMLIQLEYAKKNINNY